MREERWERQTNKGGKKNKREKETTKGRKKETERKLREEH